jgi:uncharacterized protein (DUF4415 family)
MSIVRTNSADLQPLSPERLANLARQADKQIDYSDIPELDDSFWQSATFHPAKDVKIPVALRLEPEVLAWFKAQGEGHTTRMAAILKRFYEHHQRA